jgi:hypothetical protein
MNTATKARDGCKRRLLQTANPAGSSEIMRAESDGEGCERGGCAPNKYESREGKRHPKGVNEMGKESEPALTF